MDIISVSQKIQEKIKTLELGREILRERATEKANAIGEYEKQIAKVLIFSWIFLLTEIMSIRPPI